MQNAYLAFQSDSGEVYHIELSNCGNISFTASNYLDALGLIDTVTPKQVSFSCDVNEIRITKTEKNIDIETQNRITEKEIVDLLGE